MKNQILDCGRGIFPTVLPMLLDESFQGIWNSFDDMFRRPLKTHFAYPLDILKVINKDTGEIEKYVFTVALAGIKKDEIKVRIKNNEYLQIEVNPDKSKVQGSDSETEIYITKTMSFRTSSISFRLFSQVDMEKFKPVFKDGLLTVQLYFKKQEDDVLEAEIE